VKTTEEEYWRRVGLMEEAIENITVNIETESSGEAYEEGVSTCCPDSGITSDTASEENNSSTYSVEKGTEG
jgi:hypothetical protein